jgi:hypothetical protein
MPSLLPAEVQARFVIGMQAKLELFVGKYMLDKGIGVQMVETISKELPNVDAAQLFSTALSDVIKSGSLLGRPEFSLQRVIDGAASLEFLVRYARILSDSRNTSVLPRSAIPDDLLLEKIIGLFHNDYQLPEQSESQAV